MASSLSFTLNGKPTTLNVDPERKLLWVLRTDLELTGSRYGCGEGYCGACAVLVDGDAMRSCQLSMQEVAGKNVVTVEGLLNNGALHPVQKAFMENDALQCGYCTSGMIVTAASFLKKNPHASREEIIKGMDDNLCRCGAHKRIVEAIETVVKGS